MALTANEIQCVVLYLGWPAKTVEVNSTHYSKIFVDRITTIPAEAEPKVRKYLDKIETLRDQLESAMCRLTTTEVDDIKLREDEIQRLKGLENYWVCQLSDYLDLPVIKSCNGANISVIV